MMYYYSYGDRKTGRTTDLVNKVLKGFTGNKKILICANNRIMLNYIRDLLNCKVWNSKILINNRDHIRISTRSGPYDIFLKSGYGMGSLRGNTYEEIHIDNSISETFCNIDKWRDYLRKLPVLIKHKQIEKSPKEDYFYKNIDVGMRICRRTVNGYEVLKWDSVLELLNND